jgi:hypothetical protein
VLRDSLGLVPRATLIIACAKCVILCMTGNRGARPYALELVGARSDFQATSIKPQLHGAPGPDHHQFITRSWLPV